MALAANDQRLKRQSLLLKKREGKIKKKERATKSALGKEGREKRKEKEERQSLLLERKRWERKRKDGGEAQETVPCRLSLTRYDQPPTAER